MKIYLYIEKGKRKNRKKEREYIEDFPFVCHGVCLFPSNCQTSNEEGEIERDIEIEREREIDLKLYIYI
jgi:hypothetical protein